MFPYNNKSNKSIVTTITLKIFSGTEDIKILRHLLKKKISEHKKFKVHKYTQTRQ